MNVKFLNLQKQNKRIKKQLMSEISDIIDSCAFVSGKRVEQFEQQFAEYCDAKYCVATSSGTSALHAALYCYKYSGEVLTTPNSFIATSEAISYCPNFKHKFVDVNSTCNMSFDNAVKAAGPPQAGQLGITTRIAIIVLAVAMGMDQMGVASDIINIAFGIVVGSIAIAVAVAFGIGGREVAAQLVREWTDSITSKKK